MYEYIVQKESHKAKICVEVNTYGYQTLNYRISRVEILPKGKRKWIAVGESIRDEYAYRKLDFDGKNQYAKEKYLQYVTWEDICVALDYAHEQMKPDYDKVEFRVI